MRTETCIPREPDVFGQPISPSRSLSRMDDLRHPAKLIPAHARHRIEIDPQLVRVIEIVGTDRMRVEFEAGEVRHPGQPCRITRHDFLRGATGREAQRDDVDPGGREVGARFW